MSTKLDRPTKKSNKSALLAVSGGVDSIVLLDLLAKAIHESSSTGSTKSSKIGDLIREFVKTTNLMDLELAYIDHSQREDTELDMKAIQILADKFSLKLHVIKLDLPKESSEQLARDKRYEALNKIKQERGLDHIITAHHADDVLETALINLTRGTGPRGLSSLQHQPDGIWRPFLYKLQEEVYITKRDILDYAQKEDLVWHEDSTNKSSRYLRNQIRQRLNDSSTPEGKLKILKLISKNIRLTEEISQETDNVEVLLQVENKVYSVELFRLLPEEVKDQFLHKKITEHGFDVNKQSVARAKEFIQTKTTGKILQLKGCEVKILKKGLFSFASITREKPN